MPDGASGRDDAEPADRQPGGQPPRPSASEPPRPATSGPPRPSAAEQISRAREALAAARAAARADGRSLTASPAPAGDASDSGAGWSPRARRAPGDAAGAQAAGPGSQPDPLVPDPLVPAPRAEPPRAERSRAGRRVRRDDPQALGMAIERLLHAEGWNQAAATGSVFGRWAQIVGADLAGHTKPESLRDGELTVIADSTAWATQVRLLSAQLVHRLNVELGHGTVLRVKVRGPVTVDRKPGEWRVRGSRGPRDTYG